MKHIAQALILSVVVACSPNTDLRKALSHADPPGVALALRKGAKPDHRHSMRRTPRNGARVVGTGLSFAVTTNRLSDVERLEIVSLLLDAGADPSQPGVLASTVRGYIRGDIKREVFTAILDAGAIQDPSDSVAAIDVLFDERRREGQSVELLRANLAAELLLAHGADREHFAELVRKEERKRQRAETRRLAAEFLVESIAAGGDERLARSLV